MINQLPGIADVLCKYKNLKELVLNVDKGWSYGLGDFTILSPLLRLARKGVRLWLEVMHNTERTTIIAREGAIDRVCTHYEKVIFDEIREMIGSKYGDLDICVYPTTMVIRLLLMFYSDLA